MKVITKTKELTAFCEALDSAEYITVDTEFMREKTYWPHLCLIQVAGENSEAAIDPLADGINLSPLYKLFKNTNIVKVFHAARQDLEIFHKSMGELPAPMFDTQVAAMVCGFGESVGYETLVNKITGQQLDKSSRFTDWSHRPLTNKQITYAISDVTHLRDIYKKLSAELEKSKRSSWVEEEMAILTDPAIYEQEPRNAWKRIKKGKSLKPKVAAILREVAAWRESEAQRKNIPRNRMLREEALLEIAHHAPSSVKDLARTRGLGKGLAEGKGGEALLKAVEKALAMPAEEYPQMPARRDLPRNIAPVIELLKVLLRIKCQENDVAPKLVASSQDIEEIAAYGEEADVPALHGWRNALFGIEANKLRNGKVGLKLQGKKVKIIELEGLS
ncbi:MAG: ribonuclease D [Alphaproteobacteria bacterium]|nr:ribonuclease D [Alphaproteobacteria bacterium]